MGASGGWPHPGSQVGGAGPAGRMTGVLSAWPPEAFLHYSEAVRGNGITLDLELRVLASSSAPSSHLWFDGIQQIPNSR